MSGPAIEELEQRLQRALSAGDVVAEIDATNALAWEFRNTRSPRAHALARQARDRAVEHAYVLGQARALRTMAMTVDSMEQIGEIFHFAEEARRLFDEAGDDEGRAASRDFLSSLHEHVGDVAGGLELALDALSIARRIGDPIRQGYALSSVGGLLAASGDSSNAVLRLDEALALFQNAGDELGVATIRSRLAKILVDSGRFEEALRLADECFEYGGAADGMWSLWTAWYVRAEVAKQRGRTEDALRMYRTAISVIDADVALPLLSAPAVVAIARLLASSGRLDEAVTELSELLAQIEGNPMAGRSEVDVHDVMADLMQQRGDSAAALAHLRKAQALRDAIARREASGRIAQIEARAAIEAARKDAEIHRLKYVELQGMHTQLVEAEKMTLLGRLAAGTAHELNTPLGVLRSNQSIVAGAIGRLLALVPHTPDVEAKAHKLRTALDACNVTSEQATQRIWAIADSFRRFAHLDQAERTTFDVRDGISSVLAVLASSIPTNVRIETQLDDVPEIVAWPRELNHAFFTVLENAVAAIDGEGVVHVRTSSAPGYVLVEVRDSGRGMSAERTAKLFDVDWSDTGSRTKLRLGLSAASATARRHGGTIGVESVPGHGTTITFRLPIASS